jgi:hypothetical protein
MIIIDPQRRWNTIREPKLNWLPGQGGCPKGEVGRPASEAVHPSVCSRAFSSLLGSKKVYVAPLSLCKPNMWAFLGSFQLTPCRNRHSPKLMEFCQCTPYIYVVFMFRYFSCFIDEKNESYLPSTEAQQGATNTPPLSIMVEHSMARA